MRVWWWAEKIRNWLISQSESWIRNYSERSDVLLVRGGLGPLVLEALA